MTSACAGIVPVIHALAARGARLGVITSKLRDTAARGLHVAGISDPFEFVITFDDVTHGKPHPEPVLLAPTKMQIRPEEAVFIGDSPHDVEAGNRAQVSTAAATWGPFSREVLAAAAPTYWLESPQDILAL